MSPRTTNRVRDHRHREYGYPVGEAGVNGHMLELTTCSGGDDPNIAIKLYRGRLLPVGRYRGRSLCLGSESVRAHAHLSCLIGTIVRARGRPAATPRWKRSGGWR